MEEGWKNALTDEFKKEYFEGIRQFIRNEKNKGKIIYPPGPQIFRAFDLTPYDRLKVVILGQDPYHGPGQAEGLSFSVPMGIKAPPSLINVYKELQVDLGIPPATHGHLVHWAQQGVLLLNAILTVNANEPGSHKQSGWENFTDAVIRKISSDKKGIIFLLWGKVAQQKQQLIDSSRHHVLCAAHPSPLAGNAFQGCRHFSKTNTLLREHQLKEIDWELK